MNFLYKFAKSRSNDDADTKPALVTTGGNLAAIGAGVAANEAAVTNLLLDGKKKKYAPTYLGKDAIVSDKERESLIKTMDEFAGKMGYKRDPADVPWGGPWTDVSGKGRDPIWFDPRMTHSMESGGPKMEFDLAAAIDPSEKLHRHIRLGDSPHLRQRHILAHELGHAMQGRGKLIAYMPSAALLGTGISGLGVTGIIRDSHNSDALDKVDAGLAALGTAGGLTLTGIEADASWRGSKVLADAPTRWGRIKQRAQAFRGVPSYAALSAVPAAMYFTGKALRNRIGNKEE